jgi:hypothetical protein
MGNCACCKNEKKGRYEVSVPGGDVIETGHNNNRVSRAQKAQSEIAADSAVPTTIVPLATTTTTTTTRSNEVKQNGSSYNGNNSANAAADGAIKTEDVYASVKKRKKSSTGAMLNCTLEHFYVGRCLYISWRWFALEPKVAYL